jgi:hypothetical protein
MAQQHFLLCSWVIVGEKSNQLLVHWLSAAVDGLQGGNNLVAVQPGCRAAATACARRQERRWNL